MDNINLNANQSNNPTAKPINDINVDLNSYQNNSKGVKWDVAIVFILLGASILFVIGIFSTLILNSFPQNKDGELLFSLPIQYLLVFGLLLLASILSLACLLSKVISVNRDMEKENEIHNRRIKYEAFQIDLNLLLKQQDLKMLKAEIKKEGERLKTLTDIK